MNLIKEQDIRPEDVAQVRKLIDTVNRLEELDDIGSLMKRMVFKTKTSNLK